MTDSATVSATYTIGISYSLSLDNATSMPALTVGVPVTISGTIKNNGVVLANASIGINDGINMQCRVISTDSKGHFSFVATPITAKPALIEYLDSNSKVFANSVYQIKDKSGNATSWMVSAISLNNASTKTMKLKTTSPFGNVLTYTIKPGETTTVIKSNKPALTFKPSINTGHIR